MRNSSGSKNTPRGKTFQHRRLRTCKMLYICLLLLLCLWGNLMETESKRVLVIPLPLTSHTKYNINIARALSTLGHQVWVTMPTFLIAKDVLDTSNLTVLEYHTEGNVEETSMQGMRDEYFLGKSGAASKWLRVVKDFVSRLLKNETFFDQIRTFGPDFVIVDNWPGFRIMAVIPYRLEVPFAFVGAAYTPATQRIPFSPAVTPVPYFPFTDHMTLRQKLQNLVFYLIAAVYDIGTVPDAVSRYAPEMPYLSTDMLVAKADLWLVETDHIMDYPRSSVPNVKLFGGTAAKPAKPLSPPYSSFMDSAHQGVVIVSFGSYVLDLPKAISDKIFNVLLELPFKAVFRSNLKSPDPEKILTASWIPQNDLLGHNNTKVFVSHGGNSGQYEALFHAVPFVTNPICADQMYNAERARVKGFGEIVDVRTISVEELRDTILKVAFTPNYKASITRASEIFKVELGVPMEKAAFWLNHVIKYGGKHMRSAGQDIPYYQFIGLDILFCCFGVQFILLWFLFRCFHTLFRRCFHGQKVKTC